ncbi:MAG: hypothetical protein ACLTDR_14795 [Adlercreutzia equolifaciens]
MELAGVQGRDSPSRSALDNAMNIVKAAAEGLKNMESPVAGRRAPRHLRGRDVTAGKENYMADANKTLRLTQVKSAIGRKHDQGRTPARAWACDGHQQLPPEQVDNECKRPWHDFHRLNIWLSHVERNFGPRRYCRALLMDSVRLFLRGGTPWSP